MDNFGQASKEIVGSYVDQVVTSRDTELGNAVNNYVDSIDGAVIGIKCTF